MENSWRVELNYGGRVRWPYGCVTDLSHTGYTDDYDLLYCWAGRGVVTTPEGEASVFPGVMLCLQPGFRFLLRQDPANPLGQNYIHFSLLTPEGRPLPSDALLPAVLRPGNPTLVYEITSRVIELCFLSLEPRPDSHLRHQANRMLGGPFSSILPRRDTPEFAAATALFHGLLVDLVTGNRAQKAAPSHRKETALITQTAMRILENPLEMPTVEELAGACGYCPDHFTRLFRQLFGKSPKRFMQEARLAKGESLLANTTLAVKEIAAFLQFRDEEYFTRLFTRYYGMSPTRYRQAGRTVDLT